MAAVDTRIFNTFALKFRNQDPSVYEKFIRNLDQYVTEITAAVTEAPPDQVLNAQGRAQQARKFFQLLTEFREENGKPVA
jgi:hypothetical protein